MGGLDLVLLRQVNRTATSELDKKTLERDRVDRCVLADRGDMHAGLRVRWLKILWIFSFILVGVWSIHTESTPENYRKMMLCMTSLGR